MTSADNSKTKILSSAPSELDLTPIALGNGVMSFHAYQKHIFYGPQLKTREKKYVRLLFGSEWLENGIVKEMPRNIESLSGAFSAALWMSPCQSICLSWLSKYGYDCPFLPVLVTLLSFPQCLFHPHMVSFTFLEFEWFVLSLPPPTPLTILSLMPLLCLFRTWLSSIQSQMD